MDVDGGKSNVPWLMDASDRFTDCHLVQIVDIDSKPSSHPIFEVEPVAQKNVYMSLKP
jgi:hypothetical protein